MTMTAEKPIWGHLMHLSMNMWEDVPGKGANSYHPHLLCEDDVWERVTRGLADAGANMVVIDLGDGVIYRSHPEIAVEGAWSVERLRDELDRLRSLGLEPIPKLNFSTTHDTWLGEYSRMVSTDTYYRVCTDLIDEVAGIFAPRFFHIGMDEENAASQSGWELAVARQGELWWHDLELLVAAVERHGARAWIWSDYAWAHPREFYARMSRQVVQSNWYYRNLFDGAPETSSPTRLGAIEQYRAYVDLDRHGFDQIPAASNWLYADNLTRTVDYALRSIRPERLLGFMQTTWRPTTARYEAHIEESIRDIARAIEHFQMPRELENHDGE